VLYASQESKESLGKSSSVFRSVKKKRHVSSARGTGLSSSFVSSRARSRAEGEEEQKVFVFARVVVVFIVTFFFFCCCCCRRSFERGGEREGDDDDELETPEERRFPGENSISKRVRVDEERKKCDRVQSDGGWEQRRRWQRREYVRARAEKSVG
jgi:hypothetical protein